MGPHAFVCSRICDIIDFSYPPLPQPESGAACARLRRAALGVALSLCLGAACAEETPPSSTPLAPSTNDTVQDTATPEDTAAPEDTGPAKERTPEEEMFYTTCARCHGDDGDSGSAPNLSQIIPRISDDYLTQVILEGTSIMPGDQVPASDVPALIGYLRQRYP